MKKIISLLVATAMSMAAFTSIVSANSITSSNKATLAISCVEIDEEDALSEAQEFAADAELEDYSYYRVTVTAGNLPALAKNSTKYTGEGITGVSARVTITSEGEYESDWNLAVPAGKGSFTIDGDDYTLSYFPANDLCSLIVAANVTAGASQDVATFDMVISNDYTYTLVLDGGSNMAAATFANATKTKGTDPYDITAAFGNIAVTSTPIVLNGTGGSDPDPGIAADDEVATQADGASLTDLNGDAVTLHGNYGITKFSQTLNTAAKEYYLYAKDTEGNTNINVNSEGGFETAADREAAAYYKIDFAIESIEAPVSFYAIIHSTTRTIDTMTLIEVAK